MGCTAKLLKEAGYNIKNEKDILKYNKWWYNHLLKREMIIWVITQL
jgi:hypothetical protein